MAAAKVMPFQGALHNPLFQSCSSTSPSAVTAGASREARKDLGGKSANTCAVCARLAEMSQRDSMMLMFPGAWAMGDGLVHGSDLVVCSCKREPATPVRATNTAPGEDFSSSFKRLAGSFGAKVRGCFSNITTALAFDAPRRGRHLFPEYEPQRRARSVGARPYAGPDGADALAFDRKPSSPADLARFSKKYD